MATHKRFNRKVWACKKDFLGALAKWLVKQSPYIVPENLSLCIKGFSTKLSTTFVFDKNGMVEISLNSLTEKVYKLLEGVPEIMLLNERKNKREGHGFTDRYSSKPDPDDDFIDIMAVAQNITCEFATDADAEAYLEMS